MKHTTTVEYLDACKEKLGLPTGRGGDYQLSKHLGLTRQALSRYRCEGATFSNETAKKIAAILDIHYIRVRADAELERAKSPEDRAMWRELVAKIGAVLVVAGAGGLLTLAGGKPVQAAGFYISNSAGSSSPVSLSLYALHTIFRRWLRRLAPVITVPVITGAAG